ncbi:MAG TPA: RDD family protein [Thermoanaerobaculia bacterium]|nr:RDD family protein [Thermoanaerobaculia bacterium]
MDSSFLGAAPRSRSRSGPQRSMAASSTSGPVTARLGDRLIAVILDSIFVAALLLVIAAAVISHWPHILENTSRMILTIGIAGTALLVAFIYYWLQEGAFGATMGKAIIGLRVTRPDGSVPGLGSSAIRNAFRLVDGLPLYMPGFFVAAFTRGRRRLGDFAAKTFVLEHAVPIGERVAVVFLWLAGISAAVWGAWMMCPTWFQLPLR